MKWFLNILAIVFILIGIVWLLQGINILPGSFMSGQLIYAVLGIILGVIGISLLAFNNRRRMAATGQDDPGMDR